MEIDSLELSQAPRFMGMFKEAHGGLKEVLRMIRFSYDPAVKAFLKTYDSTDERIRNLLPWEVFALKAGVDIPHLVGAMILALREQGANLVKIIAITHHAETVKARIRAAKKPDGVRDRNALDTALGLLPKPKGVSIIFPIATAEAPAPPQEEGELPTVDNDLARVIEADDIEPDDLFPDLADTQKLLAE